MPKSIEMEEDYPSKHTSGKLPILDLQVWVGEGQVLHLHYRKPMASKSVINRRSAFTTREMKNILLEEASRRLRNCSPNLPWVTKAAQLTELNIQMLDAGHSQDFRDLITTRAVAKYSNSLKNHRKVGEGQRRMYRTREEREKQWEEQGGRPTKANWFRKGGYTSVINVPATSGSQLANRVEEVLQRTTLPEGCRPRVQERPGKSVLDWLTNSNTFPRESCGRAMCPWVARDEACWEKCYQDNICYVAFCLQCRAEQLQQDENNFTEGAYIGESRKSVVTRIESHFASFRQAMAKQRRQLTTDTNDAPEETSSFMADHVREKHGGNTSQNPHKDFEFHILASYNKVLNRLVAESVWIEWAEVKGVIKVGRVRTRVFKELLNRQGEYFNFNPRGRQVTLA